MTYMMEDNLNNEIWFNWQRMIQKSLKRVQIKQDIQTLRIMFCATAPAAAAAVSQIWEHLKN